MLHGDADELVLYRDSEVLYERLGACGCDVSFVRVHGAPHEGSFWSLPLLEIISSFIESRLSL